MLGNLNNLVNWFLFSFFVMGSLGGVVYFVRLMFWKEARTEVTHRYVHVPIFVGPHEWQYGRPGDMGHHEEPEAKNAG